MATGAVGGQWADVFWLAWQDIRRDLPGYLTSAVYMLVLGAMLAPRAGYETGNWGPEVAFLAMVFILTQPFFSRDYMSWEKDRVATRLTFQRIMPIPIDVILRSRMLSLIAAGVVNIPAFFLPFYFLGEWTLDSGHYVAFMLFWTGMSLIGTGYGLCMEVGVSVRRYTLTNVVVVLFVIAILTAAGAGAGIWLVERSVEQVAVHPVLMALSGLLVGVAGYIALGRVATDRLRKRELTP